MCRNHSENRNLEVVSNLPVLLLFCKNIFANKLQILFDFIVFMTRYCQRIAFVFKHFLNFVISEFEIVGTEIALNIAFSRAALLQYGSSYQKLSHFYE